MWKNLTAFFKNRMVLTVIGATMLVLMVFCLNLTPEVFAARIISLCAFAGVVVLATIDCLALIKN